MEALQLSVKKTLPTILMILALVSPLFCWRLFDGVMVSIVLFLILARPLSFQKVRQTFKRLKPFTFALVSWVVVVYLGILRLGAGEEILDLRWTLGFYICVLLSQVVHQNDYVDLKKVSLAISITLFLALLYSYFQTGYPPGIHNRLKGFLWNPNVYGMALATTIAFLLGLTFNFISTNKRIPILSSFTLAIAISSLYVTYSRSSWLGVTAAVFLSAFLLRSNQLVRRIVSISFVSSIIAFGVDFLSLRSRLINSFDLTDKASTSTRLEIWRANIQMFLDHPFIGVGYWRNTELLAKYSANISNEDLKAHAHNQYLQILSTNGIIGLLAYLSIMIVGFSFFLKNWNQSSPDSKTRDYGLAGILVIISYAVTSLTDTPLDSREPRSLLLITLGLCAGGIISNRSTNP